LASPIHDQVSIAQMPFDEASNETLCAATLGNGTFTWVSAALRLPEGANAQHSKNQT
jgi:hypothetical protein